MQQYIPFLTNILNCGVSNGITHDGDLIYKLKYLGHWQINRT